MLNPIIHFIMGFGILGPLSGSVPIKSRDDVYPTEEVHRKFVSKSCTEEQKNYILTAHKDTASIAWHQTVGPPEYKPDIPHENWFGKDWNNGGGKNIKGRIHGNRPYLPCLKRSRISLIYITENFRKMKRYFSKDAPGRMYVYWSCHDPLKRCKEIVNPDGSITFNSAYTELDLGYWYSDYKTNFCPSFFKYEEPFQTRLDALSRAESRKSRQVMESYDNTHAKTMYHELWHYGNLISWPYIKDVEYGALDSFDLARQSSEKASINADSYAYDAMAIFAQIYFSL